MADDEQPTDTTTASGQGTTSQGATRDVEVVTAGASFGQRLARVLWLVVLVVFAIFASVNAQFVDFNWVVGETEVSEVGGDRTSGGVPLIVLMVASFVLGAMVAWLASWRSRRKQLKQLRARS